MNALQGRSVPGAADKEHVVVARVKDPTFGALILARDYYDAPLRYFTAGLIRALAKAWAVDRSDIVFLSASVGSEYAGFVLAHTLGAAFWRTMAKEQRQHALSFALAWARTRSRFAAKQSSAVPVRRTMLDVPRQDRPFSWSPAGSGAAALEMVYVAEPFRKAGVGRRLIDSAAGAAQRGGARSIEAHIDGANTASARAFLGAGWQVFAMRSGDYLATKAFEERP